MNIRTRIRRWWIGADLYDRAVMTVAITEGAGAQGAANARAWLRENDLSHLVPDDQNGDQR